MYIHTKNVHVHSEWSSITYVCVGMCWSYSRMLQCHTQECCSRNVVLVH